MRRLLTAITLGIALLGAGSSASQPLVIVPVPEPHVAVLLLHQISTTPIESAHGADLVQQPWATPAQFDALLTTLESQGYHTIALDRAMAYLSGAAGADSLPEKPLLITFDDGYRSAWTEGTPILRKHHATATMFFEGHATDNPKIPGRLSNDDLRAMTASRVWRLESHGWAGHSPLKIDAAGALTPYWYANLAWLPQAGRLETPAEFEARVEADLRRMRTVYEPIVGAPITIFAYPSGEYGQNPALPAGADPITDIEAGHSNAPGLMPLLTTALKNAGYTSAFAVSLPVTAHFASPSDSIWTIPRIGVGATFDLAFFERVAAERGAEYPEVANGHVADVGPICAAGPYRYAAATNAPVIFTLDTKGRLLASQSFPELIAGRPSGSAAISGLSCGEDGRMIAVQKAGFDPNPTPYIDRFTIRGNGSLALDGRMPLAHAMNWLVGIAREGSNLYGIDDGGEIFDVTNGRLLGSIDPAIPATGRHERFAGLAARQGVLYAFDRAENSIVAFTAAGSVLARTPIDGDIEDLTFDGSRLLVSSWTKNVRSMREFVVQSSPQ